MAHFLLFAVGTVGHETPDGKLWGFEIDPILDGLAVPVGPGDAMPNRLRSKLLGPDHEAHPWIILASYQALRAEADPRRRADFDFPNPLPTCQEFAPRFRKLHPGGVVVQGEACDEWSWETAVATPDRRFLFGWPLVGIPDYYRPRPQAAKGGDLG